MIVQTTSLRGQNIRSGPGLQFTAIGALYPFEVATVESFATDEWAEVKVGSLRGFAMRSLLQKIETVVAEMGHAGVGVHGPAADTWAWDEINREMIRVSRVEAVKLLCAGNADHTIVEMLRSIRRDIFIKMRMYAPITSKQRGSEVMSELIEPAMRLYQAGVRYIEIANEPNLYNGALGSQEGFGVCWQNGYEFSDWWMEAAAYLRSHMPEAKLGFPAMSPGPDVPGFRYSPDLFMVEADHAVQASDWVAMHTYWQDDNVSDSLAEIGAFARRFPHKVVMVTEFSNASAHISKDWKAQQYIEFWQRAKRLPKNVGPLICFTLDGPFKYEAWRGSEIAKLVGARAQS